MVAATPSDLCDDAVRRGIELLYFGYASMIRGADMRLADDGLGRAHHRALYFIARRPGLSVSHLIRLLGVTKQSLSRVLQELAARGLVETSVGPRDRRQRMLMLTDAGARLEAELFERLRGRVAVAYADAGQQAVDGFWAVLAALIPPEDRALLRDLDARPR